MSARLSYKYIRDNVSHDSLEHEIKSELDECQDSIEALTLACWPCTPKKDMSNAKSSPACTEPNFRNLADCLANNQYLN